MLYDVIILGSGPAGLTAGIYTSRAKLSTLLIAGSRWGGQLMLTTDVENYPGFPEGVLGPELMDKMRKQAERFGVVVIDRNAAKVDFKTRPFSIWIDETQKYEGKSVIIATGANSLWLDLPNEQRLIGHGVSSCAPCDGFFFKDKKVIVVGGGDTAMEEALVLTKFATEVTIVHRRDAFRASKIMQDRVLSHPKIKVLWNTTVVDVLGENKVEGVRLQSTIDNKQWDMPIDGVFVAIGYKPSTDLFAGQLQLDVKGYAVRGVTPGELLHPSHADTDMPHEPTMPGAEAGAHHPYRSSSSIPGVFIGGDVHDHHFRQVVTAAGYGCEAAMEVEKWLAEQEGK